MAQELGKDGRPILAFASQAEWEAWLDAEHRASDGVWIKFAKKGSGVGTVVYAEALDVALCYGWIDSQVKSLDERFYLHDDSRQVIADDVATFAGRLSETFFVHREP